MKSFSSRWLAATGLYILLTAPSVFALDPALPPGKNFNLATFKLQTPVPNGKGSVMEISGEKMSAGYTSPYFRTGPDGAMLFWCPVTGARTPNAKHPRSELRELPAGGDWTLSGSHIMTARCKVLQVPSNGRTIIGQIHGSMHAAELLKLRWSNGLIEARVEPDRPSEIGLPLGTYKLGDTIDYTIQMIDGKLTVTLNGQTVTFDYTAADWQTDRYYFKAGNYVQDNKGPDTEGSIVAFYALSVSHGKSATGAASH